MTLVAADAAHCVAMGDLFDDLMRDLRRRQAAGRDDGPREPRRVGPDHEPNDGPGDGGPDDPDRPRPIRGSGRGDRRDRGRGSASGGGRRFFLLPAIILVLVIVFLVGRALAELITDLMWYDSVGYQDVLLTRLGAQVGLFVLGGIVALIALTGNLWLAGRLSGEPPAGAGGVVQGWIARLNEAARAAERAGGGSERPRGAGPYAQAESAEAPDITALIPFGRVILGILAVLVVLGTAGGISGAWQTVLLWLNRVPFAPDGHAVTDPIFGRDIGFFLFELPFLRVIQSVAVGLLIASLLIAAGRYAITALVRGLTLSTAARVHLAVLGGLALLAIAYGYQLDKLELVYGTRGVGAGVAYADANAQFFAYDLLTILSGLAAAFVVGAAFTRWVWPLGGTLTVWFLASILVGRLYPEAIQRLVVDPNRLAQEAPYIRNNIAMTRLAFGFAAADGSPAWDDSRRYRGDQPLSATAIEDEEATFRNARLWDYRPLGNTLDQLQTIRRYYDFVDVDTDRYLIGGVSRQVMVSARELDLAGNPDATGFVNQRIIFTHGVGVAMVPVNEVASEGQPRLFIRNLPPISSDGAPDITEPRIYFGERLSEYVVVGAKQAEFDYPRGKADPTGVDVGGVETRWTGKTGIPIGSTFARLLWAWRFGSLDLFISDQITADSQLLFHRSLRDRVPRIAPFLRYDKDPYVVVDGAGRLAYVWDAYTTTDLFPHANSFTPSDLGQASGLAGPPFNYIRNSVKVVVDAYDGTTTLYVADQADPLIRAWQGVFPSLFRPLSDLPSDLAAHLRVPEEGFNVQTRMYGRYHVRDQRTFFQNDDLWTVPTGQTSEQTLPSEAYYVIMRLPGEPDAEFLLLQPMVPRERPNMIAWVAARSDAPNYGAVRVYNFPADTTVFGPAQIEARIDQDPVISAQVTLWNQSGSQVIRGNLIVVPVGDSLIYLQPVYLQSTGSSFPEFQRIVVASPTDVVWAPTLGESLRLLIEAQGTPGPGSSPSPSPTPAPTPSGGPAPTPSSSPGDELPSDVASLIDYALAHDVLAKQALADGDFARYGEEIAKVEAALQRLDELTPASPSPS